MVKVQENSQSKAIFVIIPKAIATARGLKKGSDVEFLINDNGQIVISIKK